MLLLFHLGGDAGGGFVGWWGVDVGVDAGGGLEMYNGLVVVLAHKL